MKALYYWLFISVIGLITFYLSASMGAIRYSGEEIVECLYHYLSGDELQLNERIFMDLRMPRIILSFFAGGILAASGFITQQVFRNPIVEPGMIGTSSGAAFGAALFIVFGSSLGAGFRDLGMGLFSFVGATVATLMVFALSRFKQHFSVISLLLVGIAVNALFLSGVGLMSYLARDPQARSITFWSLGMLSGATWFQTSILAGLSAVTLLSFSVLVPKLKILQIGDDNAKLLGINVKLLQITLLFVVVVVVSILTSFIGIISFVGLIVPHICFSLFKVRYESQMAFIFVSGGIFLMLSDLASRQLLTPIELPIGIVTSIVGVPIFILLIRRLQWS
jgi:iron complex transport system permease protein